MENRLETPIDGARKKLMVSAEQSKLERRIAGASENVSRVTITQDFAFDTFTITVEGVPAYRDNETGKQYVPGPVAVVISDMVMTMSQVIEKALAMQPAPQQPWLQHIRIDVPPMAGIA